MMIYIFLPQLGIVSLLPFLCLSSLLHFICLFNSYSHFLHLLSPSQTNHISHFQTLFPPHTIKNVHMAECSSDNFIKCLEVTFFVIWHYINKVELELN